MPSDLHLYDGIDLCSNNNIVTSNIINGSDESAVHVDDVCTGSSTGNQITKNTINSACAGILSGPGATGNTTAPNTYYNVGTLRLDGTNVCTPPLAPSRKHAAKPHPRFDAARP